MVVEALAAVAQAVARAAAVYVLDVAVAEMSDHGKGRVCGDQELAAEAEVMATAA